MLDYTMFEQKGNLYVAYDLSSEGKMQALSKMEKIETDIITIKEMKAAFAIAISVR